MPMSESQLEQFVNTEWLSLHEETTGWIRKHNKPQALKKMEELKKVFEKVNSANLDDAVESLDGNTLQSSFDTVVDLFFEIFESDPWEKAEPKKSTTVSSVVDRYLSKRSL